MPSRRRHREKKPDPAQFDAVWRITHPLELAAAVETIFDPDRWRPTIVVSITSDAGPRVSPESIAQAVGEDAQVILLTTIDMVWRFGRSVPETMLCYGGAVRVFWPPAARDDPESRHPLFITRAEDDPGHTVQSICEALRRKGYLHVDTLLRLQHHQASAANLVLAPPADRVIVLPDVGCPSAEEQLVEAHLRLAELNRENTELRKANKALQAQVEALEARVHGYRVFADPARQFEHELWLSWLADVSEDERETWKIRRYTFGPDFLDSLAALGDIDRHRIIAACRDVVTRRAWEINGRQVRQYRQNESAGSAHLVREDGATAWRCNIQTNSPSARRVMWWELPDGSCELGRVAIHDDYVLR